MVLKVKDADANNVYLGASGTGTSGDPYIPVHSSPSTGAQKDRVDRFLDTNGNGTGSTAVTGDYSSAQEIFYIQPPAATVYRLARMIVYIQDTGAFDADGYGNGSALTNGIVVHKRDDSGVIDNLTAGIPIKSNSQWGRLCFDTSLSTYGTGDESLAVRWTFTKAGQYLRLDGDSNERLEIVLDDSFLHLVDHTFLVQGYIE